MMATTLMTYRAWLRLDLSDPAGAAQRFGDADLDRALERAVAEYSQAWPRVREQTLATTAGSRELDLTSLEGLVAVEAVEWPVGRQPPAQVEWRLAPDRQTLTLLTPAAPGGEIARVRWSSRHVVDGMASTVPAEHEALVSLGAYGFAALAYSTPAADNFRYQDGATASLVDDTAIPVEWRQRGEGALAAFRRQLERLAATRLAGAWKRVVWSGG
jgi:hypothetical protein